MNHDRPSAPATEPRDRPVPERARVDSVDLLRGAVMVLMALDHTRDFFHFGATHGADPLSLNTTTVPLFLTRWVTHFCAPVFILLAGTGAFLAGTRGKSKRELSWFLVSRGLWLVLLELTFVHWAGWSFHLNFQLYLGLVIWAIGWSMVVLAALIHLPVGAITVFGLALIIGHNACDGIPPEAWGAFGWLWQVLHTGGAIEFAPGYRLAIGYPLVPWVGVMAAGYGLGHWLTSRSEGRRRRLLLLGSALTLGFVALRLTNFYGDPRPWTAQSRVVFSALSFVDCFKYPPSLCYLLMTLGPALLALGWLEGRSPRVLRPLLVFGRVPLFFYLLHLPVIHGLALLVETLRFGSAPWLFGQTGTPPPATAGFGLPVVYAAWMFALALLTPACAWFSAVKRRRREAWLSYL